jgi:hypothetical protein
MLNILVAFKILYMSRYQLPFFHFITKSVFLRNSHSYNLLQWLIFTPLILGNSHVIAKMGQNYSEMMQRMQVYKRKDEECV